MPDPEELREKLRRIAIMKEVRATDQGAQEAPVFDPSALSQFIEEVPGPRRWYVSRVYEPSGLEPYADLYFAPPSPEGFAVFDNLDAASIKALKADNPAWWEGEDFDLTFHLKLAELRRVLEGHGEYPAEQPLIEGMVFVETRIDGEACFVPYTYQAREASKQTYQKLLS